MSIVTATVYSIATATNLKSALLRGKSTYKKYLKFRPWICLNVQIAGSTLSDFGDPCGFLAELMARLNVYERGGGEKINQCSA